MTFASVKHGRNAQLLGRRDCLAWLSLGLVAPAALPAQNQLPPVAPVKPRTPLPALVSDDVLEDYRRFLGDRDPVDVTDYGGAHARRDVAEVVLIHQALSHAKLSTGLDMLARPTDARLKLDLIQGLGACTATSYWRGDFAAHEPDLLFSQALVEDGEFEAGLYTLPSNRQALAARSLEDLRRLRLLSNRGWRVDWQTLVDLGLQDRLQHVGNWSLMPRMLQSGRADVLLAPFQPGEGMVLKVQGITLVPVPGLKISMHGTRHYVLSARHPASAQLAPALDAGLQALRRSGQLKRAYTQSGFFHPAVKDWVRL
jgi:ABC-type amino acid transport substrate-binding protein